MGRNSAKVARKSEENPKFKRVRINEKSCFLKECPKNNKLSENSGCQYLKYEQIKETLNDLLKCYPEHLQIEVIGYSKEGRPIFLTLISNTFMDSPKSAVFIEAGSNGEDRAAVASALYIVNYLCKNASLSTSLKTMNYFIIPCINPDDYESKLKGEKSVNNLATNFPFKLNLCNLEDLSQKRVVKVLKKWSENNECNPEKAILIKAITDYRFAIKLFISLQEGGEKILFPFGVSNIQANDVDVLYHVANVGRSTSKIDFEVGSVYQHCGQKLGTIVDFLRMFVNSLEFTYIIHLNDRKSGLKPCDIPGRAEEILKCIALMSQEVFHTYIQRK